jgi:hypothetical protein
VAAPPYEYQNQSQTAALIYENKYEKQHDSNLPAGGGAAGDGRRGASPIHLHNH